MINKNISDDKNYVEDKILKGSAALSEPGPYEIVMEAGEQALTDAQLLAVILRTGTTKTDATGLARKVLSICDSDRGLSGLSRLSIADMIGIDGIGKVKAAQLRCVCEIARRMGKRKDFKRLDFSRPDYIAGHYMQDMSGLDREKLIAVMLDSRCRYMRETVIALGTADMAYFKPKDIFCEILKWRADAFVLLHNHPGGDPSPSIADITMTKRVEEGASLLGIKLADHIVIGDNCYVSMKNEGLVGVNSV